MKWKPILFGVLVAILVSLAFESITAQAESLGSSWTAATSLPASTDLQSCVVNSDRNIVYCIDGFAGGVVSNAIDYANLSASGAIGSWAVAKNAYPISVEGQSCVASSGYVYCVGGVNGYSWTNSAYYAVSKGAGVGKWNTTTVYPAVLDLQSCATASGYIYCIGGLNGTSYLNSVYSARLAYNGIGAWSKDKAYPIYVAGESCVASLAYVYCTGGFASATAHSVPTTRTNATYFASISSGQVGPWSKTTDYPADTSNKSCVLSSSFIYCIGGATSATYVNTVYYAPVRANGKIGNWTQTTPYPIAVNIQSCVAYLSYIGCFGGFGGAGVTNQVYENTVSPQTATVTSTLTSISTSTVTSIRNVTSTQTSTNTTTVTSTQTNPSTTTVTSTSTETSQSNNTITSTSISTVVTTATSVSTKSVTPTGSTHTVTSVSTSVLLVTAQGQDQQQLLLLEAAVVGLAIALVGLAVGVGLRGRGKKMANPKIPRGANQG